MASSDPNEDEWVDLMGSGAVLKKTLHAGHGARADRGANATIIYSLTCDGKDVFRDKELRFRTGEGDAPTGTVLLPTTTPHFSFSCMKLSLALIVKRSTLSPALDIAIPMMSLGEKALIKSCRRFDPLEGATEDSEIVYEVELKDLASGVEYEDMSPEDRVAIASQRRAKGNEAYSAGDFVAAVSCYNRAMVALNISAENPELPAEPALRHECLLCFNNLAICYMKVPKEPCVLLNEYRKAMAKCDQALELDGRNVKALTRKFTCTLELNRLEDAEEVVQTGLKVDEERFRVLEAKLRSKQRKDDREKTDLYKRMMKGFDDGKGVEAEKDEVKKTEMERKVSFFIIVIVVISIILATLGLFAWMHFFPEA
ncbi:uncharacterized protein MONBRDRAFT_22781 [Monosiga brevicollis MX1]|uniref:Peptidylprolyl isomerase n=1 Tax=Monosiga brevicollis TaxID=81824 RepID=A9US25_MONBE|nr:uncharacterized protein MONBRDRAFT_22781 [Monosiga brevicollis MX1]EDQ92029.1 predicted protein [Monosiga brevicollis MX1]|eukprot:XP_001743315.1 hypothetical protein [Monosiga brevicollis MX1]